MELTQQNSLVMIKDWENYVIRSYAKSYIIENYIPTQLKPYFKCSYKIVLQAENGSLFTGWRYFSLGYLQINYFKS